MPTTPIAAPETAVGIAPPADEEDVPTKAVLATLAMLEAPLEALLAALESVLTAVLKMDVTPETTSVVNEETTLPAAPVTVGEGVVVLFMLVIECPEDAGRTYVVATTPLVDVSETVAVLPVLADIIGPPGTDDDVARKELMPVSSAAIWVDQARKSRY